MWVDDGWEGKVVDDCTVKRTQVQNQSKPTICVPAD